MNKISQVVSDFIQRIVYTNQKVSGIVLIEEYQYAVDEYGIIRFEDWLVTPLCHLLNWHSKRAQAPKCGIIKGWRDAPTLSIY